MRMAIQKGGRIASTAGNAKTAASVAMGTATSVRMEAIAMFLGEICTMRGDIQVNLKKVSDRDRGGTMMMEETGGGGGIRAICMCRPVPGGRGVPGGTPPSVNMMRFRGGTPPREGAPPSIN